MTKEKETFYEECGKILGMNHDYVVPYAALNRPNRWNNRTPGNGRFPGIGCIHMYGERCIHVMLLTPVKINKHFKSKEEVLGYLRSITGK